MKPILADLLRLLELERLEDNFFRGESRDIGSRRVFGGQVLGQALSAASAPPPPLDTYGRRLARRCRLLSDATRLK